MVLAGSGKEVVASSAIRVSDILVIEKVCWSGVGVKKSGLLVKQAYQQVEWAGASG